MTRRQKYIVGTSGYSFADWIGTFYQPGTRREEMFDAYVRAFETVEINYTYYRMPSARTLAGLARRSPAEFTFWIKANQQLTHERTLEPAEAFVDHLAPLRESGKLAGILLQFPQSFHRTVANRRYLAELIAAMSPDRLAVEFRHFSWTHASVAPGLRDRGVTLVVPDVPEIPALYRIAPTLTTDVGYLRLHSRHAHLWYAGAVERYDYNYDEAQLRELLAHWKPVEDEASRVFAFFNNCHRGQAAENAEAFERILERMDEE